MTFSFIWQRTVEIGVFHMNIVHSLASHINLLKIYLKNTRAGS